MGIFLKLSHQDFVGLKGTSAQLPPISE